MHSFCGREILRVLSSQFSESTIMKDTLKTSPPEVALNPHSDLPEVGIISAEIPAAEPQAETPPAERPLPFGVFRGTPANPPAPSPAAN
jgi:hypothetical protein